MGNQKSDDKALGELGEKEKNARVWRTVPGKEGVVYREHAERKHGRRLDRFIAIRYRSGQGKRTVETLGWTSDGWAIDKAVSVLREIKENIRLGRRPQSLREKREMAEQARLEAEQRAKKKKAERMSFREIAGFYVEWCKQSRIKSRDVEGYLRMHILPEIGDKEAAAITPEDIARLRDVVAGKSPLRGGKVPDENRKMAPQTVLHVIKTIREVFNFASEATLPEDPDVRLFTGQNPARMSKRSRVLRPIRLDSRRLAVFNDDQVKELLRYEGGKSQKEEAAEIRDMILLSLDCGPRASELVYLQKSSVDVKTGAVRITKGSKDNPTTKGGKSRVVFAGGLFPECRKMLKRRVAMHPDSPYLFPGKDGGPRDANGLNRIMRRIADKREWNKGVDDRRLVLVWHSLRHKFATAKLEDGCDIYQLKEEMGHDDISTTEVYLHICDKTKRELALARIAMAKSLAAKMKAGNGRTRKT